MNRGERGKLYAEVDSALVIAKRDAESLTEVGEIDEEMWDRLLSDTPPKPNPKVHIISTPTRNSNFFYDEYYKEVKNEAKETEADRSGE